MRKEKKNKTFRILYLLLLILITGIMLATSTYAWFTVNRIVYVDSLNVRIEAQGGIEISTDGTTWKNKIDSDDIKGASTNYPASINQLPNKMEPVSTGGLVDNGKIMMYYGTATGNSNGDYILTAIRDIETSGNEDGKFIAFDLFLKVDNGGTLYLTNESGATYTGTNTPGIENAIRFAYLIEGNVPAGSGLGTIQSLTSNNNDDVYIWEPNYDVHCLTAIKNAYDTYGITVTQSGNNKIEYDGVISDIQINDNVLLKEANSNKYTNFFKRVEVDYATVAGFNNYEQIFNVGAGITKIRVYIWLEGQDVDCENNSAIGNIDFKFQFSTNPS